MANGVMALIPASVAKIWTKEDAGSCSLEIILAFKIKNKTENVFIRILKVTAKI
jgi:hypothetical protein